MSPFGKYDSFDDCVSKNSDKDDPDAYCATIKRQVEGKSIGGFLKSAMKAIEDFIIPHPEPSKVVPEPVSVEPRSSSFTLTKDAKGSLRWFGFVSGNFKDRDKEVFPADVHQEYVDHLDSTKQYPELWVWHTPQTRLGKADWAAFESGFLLMSGTIDAGKEATAEKIAAMPDQGMSHGFKFAYREPGVIGHYRTYEVSVLPLAHAAFPWTKIEIQTKETTMKPEKRAYLESVLGREKVEEIVSQADALQKALKAAGVDWKEFDPPAPEPAPAPNQEVKATDLMEAFKATDEFKAIAAIPALLEKMTKEQSDVTAIFDASIKALQEENKELKEQVSQKQDDVLRGLLTRRAHAPAPPPSKSKENIIPAGDPLEKKQPKLPIDAKILGSIGLTAQ